MNDRVKSVQGLLLEAVEIPDPSERSDFLARACGSDSRLRAEIEELVGAYLAAGGFLPEDAAKGVTEAALARAAAAWGSDTDSGPALTETPSDHIGRYKLLQKIGEGGCGVVYMAEQQEPVRRKVALKVIKLGMDTKQVVARFEAERQALALMDHPNIAKVLDAGATETGRPYFVMELVRGQKITQYCDEQKYSTRQRLELFIEVCRAVQHAHQKGVIHRDLKPSNILVTERDALPVPKIIDFGIAKATGEIPLTDKTLFTAFEQFIGTPAYMSPEQARLGELDIDTRSDIYSLGVLLYELLTSKTPFDTKVLIAAGLDEMRRTIREKEPDKPSTRLGSESEAELATTAQLRRTEPVKLVHLVKGDLDWIVMKCLEKDRARRYETANGLAMDIQRHLRCEPIVARPRSRLYEFLRTVRRHKLGFAAVTTLIIVLAAGVLVSASQAARARKAEREQTGLREGERQARALAEAQARIARQRAYASELNLAQQAVQEPKLQLARDLLNLQRPESGQEDLRGWEWRYLWQQCSQEALPEFCRQSGPIESLAVSADGKWLAIGEMRQGGVSVWNLQTRQEVVRLGPGEFASVGAFSPLQPLLAFSTCARLGPTNWHYSIRFWDAKTRATSDEELVLGGLCRGIAFSADGRTLITYTTDNRLTLWRVPEGAEIRAFDISAQQGLDPPFASAVTPDSHTAAYAAPDGRIRTLNLETGQELWSVKAAEDFVWALAFSPDGKILVSSGTAPDHALRVWDAVSGKEIGQASVAEPINGLAFWPDGKKLASIAWRRMHVWDVSDPARVVPISGPVIDSKAIWSVALLPDQTTLAVGCADGSVQLWDTSAVREERSRVTLKSPLAAWRFAPDSRSIMALDQRGQVARWQGNLFQEQFPLFHVGTNMLQADFSGEGELLAVATTNGLIQIWDVSRGALLNQFAASTKGMRFLPRRNALLVLDWMDRFHEWDLTSWRETESWDGPATAYGLTIAVSADAAWCLMLGSGGNRAPASLRSLVTGLETHRDLDLPEIEDAAFSPNGRLFAAASSFRGAKLWETATLEETKALLAFEEPTFSVCFSPDGKRLAIGSARDRAVTIWDVESRLQLLSLEGEAVMFSPTAFSPDGNILGSMNYKGILHLWRAPSWEWVNRAEDAKAGAKRPGTRPEMKRQGE